MCFLKEQSYSIISLCYVCLLLSIRVTRVIKYEYLTITENICYGKNWQEKIVHINTLDRAIKNKYLLTVSTIFNNLIA